MISILATVDGSAASRAVIPALVKLAEDVSARITLLTVVERPRGTPQRVSTPQAQSSGEYDAAGGVPSPFTRVSPEPVWAESGEQALDRAMAEGRDFLEASAKPLRARNIKVETEVVVEHGVAEAIVDFARAKKFDLIAMATHGRSGLNELVQGSVASAVVKSGIAPVLLVRPSKAK